jgi:hypothetical protein
MAEETNPGADKPVSTQALETPIPTVRTIAEFPVMFADGVLSHSYIAGISKFYLYRTDSSPNVSEGMKNTVVAQIIMSAQGFVQMLHFFEHRLNIMLEDGAISKELVEAVKKTVYGPPVKGSTGSAEPK